MHVQSTGKTTLCDALAGRLGLESAAYVREVARRIMRQKGYSRDTISNLQMQSDIMEAHLEEEERALGSSNIVVCDRSAVDPIVYAILTSTSAHEALARKEKLVGKETFQVALARYRDAESIIVLLAPVKDWVVDDGIRSMEQQEECMGVFQRLLEDLGIPYHILGADRRSLFDRVISVMGFGRL
jgi:nicotinamide riboside kinase